MLTPHPKHGTHHAYLTIMLVLLLTFLHLIPAGCQGYSSLERNRVDDTNYDYHYPDSDIMSLHPDGFVKLERSKRDVTTIVLNSTTQIPENVANDQDLFDLSTVNPNRSFSITGNSFGVQDIFAIVDGSKLRLKSTLSEDVRKKFDFEASPTVEVYLDATSTSDSNDVIKVTIRLQLSDINDEPPEYISEPRPYLATLAETTQGGTLVYTLTATDPDSNPDVTLRIASVTPSAFTNRFQVNVAKNGKIWTAAIVTVGNDNFGNSMEFTIMVTAQDKNTVEGDGMTTVEVKALVGQRPPQFYVSTYEGYIYESMPGSITNIVSTKSNVPLEIKTISFQKKDVSYRLLESDGKVTGRLQINDKGQISNKESIDYETLKVLNLEIEAVESQTALSSRCEIEIKVKDENDNIPTFTKSIYHLNVPEDIELGSDILNVTAFDLDSQGNGELTFSVLESDYFEISDTIKMEENNYQATIKLKRKLDYDNVADPTYDMKIQVKDKGTPTKTSTTHVSIFATNANDNPPEMDNSTLIITLREDAKSGYLVTVLQASDIDGDVVSFSLASNEDVGELFTIPPGNNILCTKREIQESDRDTYILTILATDDGSCCLPRKRLTSETNITVNIEGANNNKPSFVNCSDYDFKASVKEKADIGTLVIQVQATDPDRGENGLVTYEIVTSDKQIPFEIDEITGKITVVDPGIKRDSRDFIQVTVSGNNPVKGQPLKGWCTFRVNIEDINDHTPVFSNVIYEQDILATSKAPQIIRQIVATDKDIGKNANLTYSLVPNDIFNIDVYTGVVSLIGTLNNPPPEQYKLVVYVADNGIPHNLSSHTELHINIKNNQIAPSWKNSPDDFTEFNVSEEADLGDKIASFECVSNIPTDPEVRYFVFDSTESIDVASAAFRPMINGTKMELELSARLDYETIKEYQITIVCQNLGSSNMQALRNIIINVEDANDEIPRFVGLLPSNGRYAGSVAENAPAGSTIVTVSATDADTELNFRKVFYNFKNDNETLFQVVPDDAINSAHIIMRSGISLDRETTDEYVLTLEARNDGDSRAAIRLVNVMVTDINDNPPNFESAVYTSNVSETAPINSLVFAVTADDPDLVDQNLGLDYYFSSENNTDDKFSIRPVTGEIIVAGELDYELGPKVYSLTLIATDQLKLHNVSTTVTIFVNDENDNKPKFNPPSYFVTSVTEEDLRYTPNNPLPLIKVNATDADATSQLTYSLVEPVVNFTIDSLTGQIYLTGALDRDGPTPDFKITVRVADAPVQPLIGYADVTVTPRDINDNSPVFDGPLIGRVKEHSRRDVTVMTIVARDKDEGNNGKVEYKFDSAPVADPQYFTIIDGAIKTNSAAEQLDRENVAQILLPIVASDKGNPSLSTSATVTIIVVDVNDQSPYFTQPEYKIIAAENLVGQIGLIQAQDDDSDPKNRNFQFSLEGASNHFRVLRQNNAASINIKETDPIDFDVAGGSHEFTFQLKVNDGVTNHENSTTIKVTITDVNDNAPQFREKEIRAQFADGTSHGTRVAQFNANDKDDGLNAEVIFSIARESDPRYEFYINPTTGVVTTRKELDRETEETIDLTIIATDKGEPPKSSSATLIVELTDVNDNAPRFKENYLPKVEENVKYQDKIVVEIFATDPDSSQFGPPFGFKLPDNCKNPACSFFKLQMNNAGDNNRGTALIKTSTTFDREEKKSYYLPIIMWDMRDKNDARSLTATNTLTIIIGDKNDNKHKPGHQNIFVYNYEGMARPFEIGRVYAEDADDWDLPDKTFTFLSPDIMKNYFTVSKDTGVVEIKEGVPSNVDAGRDSFEFKVNVHDKKWGNSEICTVSVTVKTLSDQAVWKSGSMRLTGLSAEDFILKSSSSSDSEYDKFRKKLATVLGYSSKENVEIISLMDNGDYLDVRFSAHGSPYLNPAQVESAVMLHKGEFESDLGIKIQQLPINLCLEEVYDDGCYTQLNVTGQANLVNANGTSFVGVETLTDPVSGCVDSIFPEPVECRGDYCYNGGTCLKDDWGKLTCKCPPNYDGPRCQQRRHSFSGSSTVFYEGLSICAKGQTSFDFITTEKNGVIMFSGSQAKTNELSTSEDYLIVELRDGYPQIRMNLGVGELHLILDKNHSPSAVQLDDGKWHHLDIDKDGQNIILTVDKCKRGTVQNNKLDDKSCSIAGTVPGPDILLNTKGFLQLGGYYPHADPSLFPEIQNQGFSGCIRNLMHNSKLYDLSFKKIPNWDSGQAHCPQEDSICKPDGNAACGDNADCASEWMPSKKVVSCSCHYGWHGNKCQQKTPIKDFKTQSFLKWELKSETINQATREQSIQMMFRTRQKTGTLMAISSTEQKTILIQLADGKITVFYDMGEGQQKLTLDHAHASSGQWHTLRVERFGSEFTVSLDNGEGRNYNYKLRSKSANVNFNALPYVSAGARVPPVRGDVTELTYDLINSCIQDFRYNGNYLPVEEGENDQSTMASLIDSQNIADNCTRTDCVNPNCPQNSVCYPLWEAEECRCIAGTHESNPGTCTSDCFPNPCFYGGKCSIVKEKATCSCVDPWEGQLCNFIGDDESAASSALLPGEIAGIVIGILILLIIIVVLIIFIYLKCRSRQDDEKSINDLLGDETFARENIMYHEEECAGEEDHDSFDLSILQMPQQETNMKPFDHPVIEEDMKRYAAIPESEKPIHPGVGRFIAQSMDNFENDNGDDADSTKEYHYEGSNSDAGSLSTLSASSRDSGNQNYDYLDDWGPKFSRLADMYGAGRFDEQS